MFKAIVIDKVDEKYTVIETELAEQALPQEEVVVDVEFSTLNFKDGLAISGKSPVVRKFPMVPGIDFAGTVSKSTNPEFPVGEKVFLNGWGVGEKHWGGLAQKASVPGKWLLPIPDGMDAKSVMAVGTAGYTAMLAVMALVRHDVTPDQGQILVTGANGGVGSFAISFLHKLGYDVVASTGRPEEAERLLKLGATEVIDRNTLSAPGRPLDKERWAGAVDSVGSHTLANVCASTKYGGVVAACGLAQGMDFPATVAPFILRGVTLAGIDSVMCPKAIRQKAWEKIAELTDPATLAVITETIGLSEAIATANQLLEGKVKGRVIVDVNN